MDSVKPTVDAAVSAVEGRDKLRESLSALMDNEGEELELRRILRELPADGELSASWKRYHAVRASLQQEIHSNPAVNLLDGINARLVAEADSHPLVTRSKMLRSGMLRYLGQGAIAASVAVAALMSVSLLETAQTDAPSANIATVNVGGEVPVFSGDYNPSELAQTAATSTSDAEAFGRLEQAVYQELSDLSPPEQIPVNYNPDFPVKPAQ